MSISEITEMALRFPVAERAELLKSISESLDEDLDARIEELWRLEVAERIRQAEQGEISPVSAEDAHKLARSRVDEACRLSSPRK